LNKYFLLPDEKKCVTNNNDDNDNNCNTRPDIVLFVREKKTPLAIDIAVPLTHNFPKTEREKITKYENLALDIDNIWKLN
jgi:Holliday junction resolvase RusA-like endonuclease